MQSFSNSCKHDDMQNKMMECIIYRSLSADVLPSYIHCHLLSILAPCKLKTVDKSNTNWNRRSSNAGQ